MLILPPIYNYFNIVKMAASTVEVAEAIFISNTRSFWLGTKRATTG